jgi:plastocyanin
MVAACGGGGDDQASADQVVRDDAAQDGSLHFASSTVDARPGPLTIQMTNPSSIPHAIAVRGDGVDESGGTVGEGETSRVTVDLKAGTYTLYCPVGAHEQAGMVAELTVR